MSKSETMKALKKARSALRSCGHPGHDLELIPAKVPILRLHKKNIQIDINCNNLTGLRKVFKSQKPQFLSILLVVQGFQVQTLFENSKKKHMATKCIFGSESEVKRASNSSIGNVCKKDCKKM